MELRQYYSDDGPERAGFILNDNMIVECKNHCLNPNDGFEISGNDLIQYETSMIATWHTHPGGNADLSPADFIAFRNWPMLKHYVIGKDCTRCYEVRSGGRVVET